MAGTRVAAALVMLVGLAAACGGQTQASTSQKAKSCSGGDVVASSNGVVGTNDGTNPEGPGRRRSTLAGITLSKQPGSPCVLSGVAIAVMANGRLLNVPYRDFPNVSPVATLRSTGDVAAASLAWFAPWCGQRDALTFGLKWPDGSVTPTNADAVAPPCDASAGTSFVTADWVVNPGTSTRQTVPPTSSG